MDRIQKTNGTKSTQQTTPMTRIVPKTTVRPTRASLARRDMAQKQKQQEQQQSNKRSLPPATTLIPRDSNKLNSRSRYSLPVGSTKSSSCTDTCVTSTSHPRHSLPASSKINTQPRSTTSTNTERKPIQNRATTATKPQIRKPIPATASPRQPTTTLKRKSSMSSTTKEPVKKRPTWDHRGKLMDMEAALEKANNQLEGLYKFKEELLVAKEDKESERKEAIQKSVALQSEIEILEKNHEQDIESIVIQQQTYHQTLQDQQVIFQQQESSLENDLKVARRTWEKAQNQADQVMQEHQDLKEKLGQMTMDSVEKQKEIDRLDMKLERYGGTLFERERDISELQVALDKEQTATDLIDSKLKEAQSANIRIQTMVDELQKA